MKQTKQYQPLAASMLFLACSQAHAIAVTNVVVSTPIASNLTNLSLWSESKTPFATDAYSDLYTYDTGKPYLKITDDKKGTIKSEILQNQLTRTTSYKTDDASGIFYMNATAPGSSVFRLNTTVTFDPALAKLNEYGYSTGSFSMSIGGSVVGAGSSLSEVPGLTSYQAPVWAFSINGGAYQQLATSLSLSANSFSSGASIDLYSLVGNLLPDSTANVSFLVYTNQDFQMSRFDYSYTSYAYDRKSEITPAAPKVLDSVITTYEVTPVPEADSYAMLIAGLGLLGAVIRRRQTAV
ncbi:PEP-CTERM sorting domain-containing protein [Methylophilus glucosoxydans]|uniref:PEP-CTERM sorting domain-containing protein n=1 Tax=Methylophilus glucosoxydans TaxID=752553 RepID=A0ABW3GIW7_9PROT